MTAPAPPRGALRICICWGGSIFTDGEVASTTSRQHHVFEGLAGANAVDFLSFVGPGSAPEGIHSDIRLLRVSRPNRGNLEEYLLRLPHQVLGVWRQVRAHRHDWDVALLVDPQPLSQVSAHVLRAYGVPYAVYVGGRFDVVTPYHYRTRPRWMRAAAGVWVWQLDRWLRRQYRRVPMIVAGQELADRYGPRCLVVFSSSVPASSAEPDCVSRRSYDAAEPLRVIMVGRVSRIKRIELALRAFAEVVASGKDDLRLDVVGPLEDGEYGRELLRQVGALGLSSIVTFHGEVPWGEHLWRHYRRAHVLLMTSASEGTAKVLPEAMAKGVALLLPRVGGLPQAFGAGAYVQWYDPSSPLNLRDALLSLASNRRQVRAMADAALAAFPAFSAEESQKTVEEALRGLVPSRRAREPSPQPLAGGRPPGAPGAGPGS